MHEQWWHLSAHVADQHAISARTPHSPERGDPSPSVVVVLDGLHLFQALLAVPDAQRVVSRGGQHPL